MNCIWPITLCWMSPTNHSYHRLINILLLKADFDNGNINTSQWSPNNPNRHFLICKRMDILDHFSISIRYTVSKSDGFIVLKFVGKAQLIEGSHFDFFIDEIISEVFLLNRNIFTTILGPSLEITVLWHYAWIWFEALHRLRWYFFI